MTLYISPEGEFLIPGTQAFFDRIGYRNPDFDAGDYSVRNLGFVGIARNAEGALKLRFRPDILTGKAVDGFFRYIAKHPGTSITLEYLADTWMVETWPNDPAALHRIVVLCAQPRQTERRPSAPYRTHALRLDQASEDHGNPLKPLFQKWRVSLSTFDDTTLPFLLKFGCASKLIIMAAANRDDPLRFQFIGEGLEFYDRKALYEFIGKPITYQPDKKYASWIAEQYNALIASNEPRLDLVEALIAQPSGAVRRSRYERLLLPWSSPSGQVIVTCASVLISAENDANANDNPSAVATTASGDGGLRTVRHERLEIRHKFQTALAGQSDL